MTKMLTDQQIEENIEKKCQKLERHLRMGKPISARLAESMFGISGTGFHRTLNRFRGKGMILDWEWCEYYGSRFKRYFIDESQDATRLTKSRKYVAPEGVNS